MMELLQQIVPPERLEAMAGVFDGMDFRPIWKARTQKTSRFKSDTVSESGAKSAPDPPRLSRPCIARRAP